MNAADSEGALEPRYLPKDRQSIGCFCLEAGPGAKNPAIRYSWNGERGEAGVADQIVCIQ